ASRRSHSGFSAATPSRARGWVCAPRMPRRRRQRCISFRSTSARASRGPLEDCSGRGRSGRALLDSSGRCSFARWSGRESPARREKRAASKEREWRRGEEDGGSSSIPEPFLIRSGMPDLYETLEQLHIQYTAYEHEPVFTCDAALAAVPDQRSVQTK